MPDVTFIIPIGPSHAHLAERAIASARAQTVPCAVLSMVDTEKRGPGVLRNAMLAKAETEFVSFLDADDWIEPTFAEDTIAEYRRVGGDKYIFTDWFDNRGDVIATPCLNGPDGYPLSVPNRHPYCGRTWHVLTTLLPTAWVREVGGFDETLPGSEDTDFYLKLCTSKRCGHHLSKALFHYAPGGGRAIAFRQRDDYTKIMKEFSLRYGGRMGCCGSDNRVIPPVGVRQPGDVLAMALWVGNRSEYGRVTSRHYPRISTPRTAWVDPADVAKSPMLWRVVEAVAEPAVDVRQGMTTLLEMASAGMATVHKPRATDYSAPINEPPPPPVVAKPDVERVLRLGNRPKVNTDEPIFVFPEKDYPSYSDIKALVKLSGFESVTIKQMTAFSRQPYIVVSPEAIPDVQGWQSRVICWQLEYAGDYTNNYANFGGIVWASDKAWADAHGAKYVLMGSHPFLAAGHGDPGAQPAYDVTMLGYMTPRRQAIKDSLNALRWPEDYPGHSTDERTKVLLYTRLMLHVHQHDNAPFLAPQRIAIAAAYRMPVLSETTPGAGDLASYIAFADYANIAEEVRNRFANTGHLTAGEDIHHLLCISRPFRKCVEEALKSS
jgi:hypothetical protein